MKNKILKFSLHIPAPGLRGLIFSPASVMINRMKGQVLIKWICINDGAIRVTASAQTGRLATEIYSAKSGLFPATKVFKVYQDADNNEWLLTPSIFVHSDKYRVPYQTILTITEIRGNI